MKHRRAKRVAAKRQIVVIHGGDSFKTYREYLSFLWKRKIDFSRYQKTKGDWKRTLGASLGKKYEVIQPDMPSRLNAKYIEWKIWFEKFVPYLNREIVLVGHSLGALFLAKYLSETHFKKKIRATFLVAPPWSTGDLRLPPNLRKLERQGGKVVIYHSDDDPVVPISDFKKYKKSLPHAVARVFSLKGHFNRPSFPELVREIRDLFV